MKELNELRQKHMQSINEFALLAEETRIPVMQSQMLFYYFKYGLATDIIF